MTPEEIAAEEARAELWRQQAARRVAFQTELWWDLAAPPEPIAQAHANWWPLEQWLVDRQQPPVDPQDDPDIDPLGLSDTVNVGE